MVTQEELNKRVSYALSANQGRILTDMINSNIQRTVKEEINILSLDASYASKVKREKLMKTIEVPSESIIISGGLGNKVIYNSDDVKKVKDVTVNHSHKNEIIDSQTVSEYINYSVIDSFKLRLLSYISIKIKNEYLNDKIFEYVIEIRNKYIK